MNLRFHVTSLVIVALTAAAQRALPEEAAKSSWTSATFSHPIEYEQFQMLSVTGEDGKVYGEFWYNNFAEKGVPPAVTIVGIKKSDGTFWPDVALYVGNTREGEWKPLSPAKVAGEAVSVAVAPTLCLTGLKVDFAPFGPFLQTMALGKAVLPNGKTAFFDLSELLPPDQREPRPNAPPDT